MELHEDLSPKEFRIAANSIAIYDELSSDLKAWNNTDKEDHIGNIEAKAVLDLSKGPIRRMYITVGTDWLNKNSRGIKFKADTNLYLQSNLTNHGYIDSKQAQTLAERLAERGCNDIKFIDDKDSYHRQIRFNANGQSFSLKLRSASLEDDQAEWDNSKYKIGERPTGNDYFSLQTETPENTDTNELPLSKAQFSEFCKNHTSASNLVIEEIYKLFGEKPPSVLATLDAEANIRDRVQKERGYSLTTYEKDGEFEPDGKRGEKVYSDYDSSVWRRYGSEITQFRSWGNRQVLTMHKDSLVFGRWGGSQAGSSQADVLLDDDIDPATHKEIKELGVSRRHYQLTFDPAISQAVSESTGGKVKDVVVIRDLHSTNNPFIARGSDESRALFGIADNLDSGKESILLPGDVVVVGGGKKIDKTSLDSQKDRGIAIIYLGDRKFVKAIVGEENLTQGVLDIMSIANPKEYGEIKAAITPAQLQSLIEGNAFDDKVLIDALGAINEYEAGSEFASKTEVKDILGLDTNETLDMLGNVKIPTETKYSQALEVIANSTEPKVVNYAVLTVLRLKGFEGIKPLLSNLDVWKKMDPETLLVTLDHTEESGLENTEKVKLISMAFTARDDELRQIIRTRLRRYSEGFAR